MIEKNKGSATLYGMPVDKDGNVPEQALITHMHEFYDRRQHDYDLNRAVRKMAGLKVGPRVILEKKDYQTTCDRVIPLPVKPIEALGWWDDPSSCDIQDIDTMGAPKVNIPEGLTAAQKKNMGRIKVIASPLEEQMLRRELVMSFPPGDISAMAATSPVMKVVPMRRGVTGDYAPKTNVIQIDRRRGLEQGTIVHESTHELRHTDRSRHGPIVSANTDVCIEESCTVAEQMARSDRPDYNGYYAHVAVWDGNKHVWRGPTLREARRMAEEDHLLFTEGRGKGLDGSAAIHSVEDHWADSHIARLRIGGTKMAINSLADQTGAVQRLSKAQPRTVRESELPLSPVTNATAGRPGVVYADHRRRKRERVILDTNIIDQGAGLGKPLQAKVIKTAHEQGKYLYTRWVDSELRKTTDPAKIKGVRKFIRSHEKHMLNPPPPTEEEMRSYPKALKNDRYILNEAIKTNADLIVTNDKRFVKQGNGFGPKVESPIEYMEGKY